MAGSNRSRSGGKRGAGGQVTAYRNGRRLHANAFPESAIAKSALRHESTDFRAGDTRHNLAVAALMARAEGYRVQLRNSGPGSDIASYMKWDPAGRKPGTITLNSGSDYWRDPVASARKMRRDGYTSSANPRHAIVHEASHGWHAQGPKWPSYGRSLSFDYPDQRSPGWGDRSASTMKRVSWYSIASPAEFVAELRAGRRLGQRYPARVMKKYREVTGWHGPS